MAIILINVILTQLPLTSTFGYEFASFNGLLLAIIAGLQTFNFIDKSEFVVKELIKNLAILFLIPFFISVIHSFLTTFCSFTDGLIFYVLIVSTSMVFGTSIAMVISLIAKRFRRLFFFIIIFLIALIPILEIYLNPQVYFYSPLIGFFPGNIYDEGLTADWKLFFHQFVIIIFSLSIIYSVLNLPANVKRIRILFLAAILIVFALFQYLSPYLGFTTTFSKLNSILPKQIESESLVLHYDGIDSLNAKIIALNQEFYYSELSTQLGVKPANKINVYLFNNREQKKIIFGAGNADVAKPWQYSIYISAGSWQSTLKHELAHVFTAEFGSGIFKLASGFNAALIEGMAESLDGISNDISIKDLTSIAFNNGYVVDIKSLFSGLSFFKGNSSLAYTYSGTFVQYLTQKYGIEKAKEFYRDGDFESVFRIKIDTAQKEFEKSIINPELSNQRLMADYYFGRLSIIQKVCPRYIGDRLSKAYKYLVENNYDESEHLFKEINNKTLNYSALIGLSEIYYKQNKKDEAINLILNNYNKFKSTSYYHNLIFRLAELYALDLQYDSAAFYYNKIINDNVSQQLNYLCNTRLSLIEGNKLFEYVDGSDSLKLEILISLNQKEYNYNSLPIIIDLIQNQNIDYKKSLSIFNKRFIVNNIISSFAAFRLSNYMLANNDFINARKYAALSLRYKENNMFYTAMQEQFEKADWLVKNSIKFLDKFVYVSKD
ncbi:MAG TPA: hypothetical protein VF870_03810 [Ignavibacteriaceae bacterium]